jgi:hypothetical protein
MIELVEQRNIALKLIAPIENVARLSRDAFAGGRVNLYEPNLIGNVPLADTARANEFLNRRVV